MITGSLHLWSVTTDDFFQVRCRGASNAVELFGWIIRETYINEDLSLSNLIICKICGVWPIRKIDEWTHDEGEMLSRTYPMEIDC